MILDALENSDQYLLLNENFEKAFDFLKRPDIRDLPVGRYEIDGETVYATVVKDSGRSAESAQLEVHREYIDIQLVLSGVDTMGWRPALRCQNSNGEYNRKSDIQFFTEKPDVWLAVKEDVFALFFPDDAHMPMISDKKLHKIIVKVLL